MHSYKRTHRFVQHHHRHLVVITVAHDDSANLESRDFVTEQRSVGATELQMTAPEDGTCACQNAFIGGQTGYLSSPELSMEYIPSSVSPFTALLI